MKTDILFPNYSKVHGRTAKVVAEPAAEVVSEPAVKLVTDTATAGKVEMVVMDIAVE